MEAIGQTRHKQRLVERGNKRVSKERKEVGFRTSRLGALSIKVIVMPQC